MADHGLERRAEERIFTEISSLKRQLAESRTVQKIGTDSLNLQASGVGTSSVSLAHNGITEFVHTLFSPDGRMMFGICQPALYQGSVAGGNEIMRSSALGNGYQWRTYLDYAASDGFNLVHRTWVYNLTGSTQTVLYRGVWRFIASDGSTS